MPFTNGFAAARVLDMLLPNLTPTFTYEAETLVTPCAHMVRLRLDNNIPGPHNGRKLTRLIQNPIESRSIRNRVPMSARYCSWLWASHREQNIQFPSSQNLFPGLHCTCTQVG